MIKTVFKKKRDKQGWGGTGREREREREAEQQLHGSQLFKKLLNLLCMCVCVSRFESPAAAFSSSCAFFLF